MGRVSKDILLLLNAYQYPLACCGAAMSTWGNLLALSQRDNADLHLIDQRASRPPAPRNPSDGHGSICPAVCDLRYIAAAGNSVLWSDARATNSPYCWPDTWRDICRCARSQRACELDATPPSRLPRDGSARSTLVSYRRLPGLLGPSHPARQQ